jgi:hypothetical protein
MTKNINFKIIFIAVIFLTGFFGFASETRAYENVALGKWFSSSHPNPYGWDGLTDGYIAGDAYQEGKYWWGTYATDASSSFPKEVIIYLGNTYDINLVRLYKEWGPYDPDEYDTRCAYDWYGGCESCNAYNSNTGTVKVYTLGGNSWTYWGEQTFSGAGGSLDWWMGSKIPAEQVYIEFVDTWYQWRVNYPCICSNCGYYVFLREAQVFGDPPPVINGACAATHYNCSSGTLSTPSENGSWWWWWCVGSNGGTTPPYCYEEKACVPNGCAASTCSDTTCWDGCNTVTGTKNCCVSNCSCAASTCIGSTCSDGCGGNCNGTLPNSCGGWENCDKGCGGGTQTKNCVCPNGTETRICNSQPCPPGYREVTPW